MCARTMTTPLPRAAAPCMTASLLISIARPSEPFPVSAGRRAHSMFAPQRLKSSAVSSRRSSAVFSPANAIRRLRATIRRRPANTALAAPPNTRPIRATHPIGNQPSPVSKTTYAPVSTRHFTRRAHVGRINSRPYPADSTGAPSSAAGAAADAATGLAGLGSDDIRNQEKNAHVCAIPRPRQAHARPRLGCSRTLAAFPGLTPPPPATPIPCHPMLRFLPSKLKEKLRARAGAVTTRARLANLRRAGFAPAKIIDAGAFRGEWATLAREIFPDARLLLIEPQPHLAPHLRSICQTLGHAELYPALLGRAPATVRFFIQESNSRILSPGAQAGPGETIVDLPLRRLEDLAAETGFSDATFLKLDLQGHELEALAGAGPLFGRVEVVLIEVSLIPIGDVPLLAEVVAAFAAKGYRVYDIIGPNHRPLDRALWQTDLIFVRLDSPLVANNAWS